MVFSGMPHDQNFKNAEVIFGFHLAFLFAKGWRVVASI